MNPGKIIVLVFVAFAALMGGFFIYSRMQGAEEVPEKYYEKGNAFQTDLDARKRASEEHYQPVVALNNQKQISIAFGDSAMPDSLQIEACKETEPNVKLTKFSKLASSYTSMVSIEDKGYWVVKCNYYRNKKLYQYNQKLFVQ